MKYTSIISIAIVINLLLLQGCVQQGVPEDYLDVVTRLRVQIERLESIPLDKNNIIIDGTTYEGVLSYKNRAKYLEKNRQAWTNLFSDFNKVLRNKKGTHWYGSALFCAAYGAIIVANLEAIDASTDAAFLYISNFLKIGDQYKMDQWTRAQLSKIFWEKVTPHISSSISEKKNLDQFFLNARASLWANKKYNENLAIKDYKDVLEIDQKSFWGCQAKQQLELLKAP